MYFVSNEFMTSLFCSYVSDNVLYEMHDYPKGGKMFFKLLFSRVRHVLTQNTIKRDMLVTEFGVEKKSIIVEHNAISVGKEVVSAEASELRAQLGISPDSFVVMYTGQLLAWKGVHTLAQALAQLGSSVQGIFLGGSPAQVTAFGDQYASQSNIFVLGYKPFFEIPKWQSVADCLVLPNTAHEKISSTYTSPMKLFEYMASKRPIIASDLPSIREIVGDTEVFFVPPDDADALKQQILFVQENKVLSQKRAETAYEHVIKNTWEQRAKRICTALAIEAL
jgi:glycosyltransferase involved in cell wall biosynthesis